MGQVFCITDDILPDMRTALGLPEDWQRRCWIASHVRGSPPLSDLTGTQVAELVL